MASVGSAVRVTVPDAALMFASIGSEQAKSQVAMVVSSAMVGLGCCGRGGQRPPWLASGVAGDPLADAGAGPRAARSSRTLQRADGRGHEPGGDREAVGSRLGLC